MVNKPGRLILLKHFMEHVTLKISYKEIIQSTFEKYENIF